MITEQMIKDCLYVKKQYDDGNDDHYIWEDYDFEYFNQMFGEDSWYCTKYHYETRKVVWKIRFQNGKYERR